jgi:beta-glucosidase
MGFSGDRTQHVLWRLDNGNIDGISPKVAVIMIGTNNSNRDDNTAEEIADGMIAICRKLRAKLPRTKILLLSVFPRSEKPCPQREKIAKANKLASKIADGRMIHYLDIGPKFLEPDKSISKEIMPDFLHLTPKGYKIWAKAIEPIIAKMMGEER